MNEVLGNNSSQSINMYWGNEEASAQSNGGAVFDTSNGFTGVWHFNEDPNGDVSDVMKDRTGTEQHLTPYGGMTSANSVAGVVGKAIDFDGVDDYLDLGTVDADFTQGVSICAWVNYDVFNRWARIVDVGVGYMNNNIILANALETNGLGMIVWPDTSYETRRKYIVDSVFTMDQWEYVCGIYNALDSTIHSYHNGVLVGQDTSVTPPSSVSRSSSYMGKSNWEADGYLDGQLDEIRMLKVARSVDWVKLSYESQKPGSNWIQIGNAQSVGINHHNRVSQKRNHFVHNGFSQLIIPAEVKQIELYSTQGERVFVVIPDRSKRVSVPSFLSKGLYHVKYVY